MSESALDHLLLEMAETHLRQLAELRQLCAGGVCPPGSRLASLAEGARALDLDSGEEVSIDAGRTTHLIIPPA